MSGSRTAIVTGGGTGIGAACGHALAASCDRVVLVGRRLDRLETTAAAIRAERPACAVDLRSVDVTDVAAVSAFVDWCSSELGHVDVLVNNAGSPQPRITGGLDDVASAWESTWRANTLSVVLMTEGLKGLLTRRGSATSGASASAGGRIVTIGSFAASLGTGSPAYASAKAALETYTVTLARDLGPEGITANVVAPGYTGGTELLEGRITPERHERLVSATAARRAGTPEEIASLVSYLASPLAGYVSGQTIIANGGTYLPG
jgi:3-oxoacyl-[acyl-carrier protein] reductase